MDAAVTAAVEMELYLGPTGGHVGHVNNVRSDEQDDDLEVMAVARGQDATTMAMLQKIFKRLDKLESKVKSVVEKKTCSAEAVICWKCREQGHMARDCPKVQNPQQPGGAVNTVVIQEEAAFVTAIKLLRTVQSECHVYGFVNKKQVDCMVDTGADVTLLSSKIWDHIKEKLELENITAQRVVGVKDSLLQIRGTAEVQLQLQTEQFDVQVILVDGLATDMVLGKDFLQENRCVVDVGNNTLHLRNRDVILTFREKYDNGAGKSN